MRLGEGAGWRGARTTHREEPAADLVESIALAAGMLRSGLPERECWTVSGVNSRGEGLPGSAGEGLRAAVALARRAGTPLADVLDGLAQELEAARDAESARNAALAGPAMSATVMAWLPLAGVGLSAVVDPSSAALLVATPLGWALLATAAMLTLAGRAWMASMMRRARRAGADPPDHVAPGVVLRLLEVALASGADAMTALDRVGEAVGGDGGARLRATARALASGRPWDESWSGADEVGRAAEPVLRRSIAVGSSPCPALAAARRRLARERAAAAQGAAARAGVLLVLPVSLCLLPAFIAVGVVPLVVALAAQVGPLGL